MTTFDSPARAGKRIDAPTGTETVGHEWDGIEELNTPLPRWWLYTFYATIVFAAVYVVFYPAWPMVERATAGTLGWSSRGDLVREMGAADAARQSVTERIAVTDIEKLAADPQLMQAAVAGGAAAFKVNCVQCHGAGAAGSAGYPNLNDDDWIWGGTLSEIEYTLTHGIRWEGSDETRTNFMPAFAGMFDKSQTAALTGHVLSLSGKHKSSPAGAQLFADNCAACHGTGGEGSPAMGAPALNDAIWLLGGTEADIARQIEAPRHGVMPAWKGRLDPVTIKMLAAYVHSRGGGQDAAPATPDAPAAAPAAPAATKVASK
ncbi:cytochrome-c oxidase, cbb3-type subunit III [Erythrobacter neustonensis]|uniref:Cbb3-type cytochrome c oxidase subunit n=1 Tax=Erythrobacter neustonensis TaxID=1112 RepID=A0A192D4L3_9SPHN|nr:cytochrome-c oxidase, cbb3-type subunit III [Erythrobacter neustonensis]ANK12971.1 cytochrome c oxidase, cbb3-type subunit III [Erythrobacter neustonensis]